MKTPDRRRAASLAILMALFLAPSNEAGAESVAAKVELRTFIAHCDARDRGLTCVVVNEGKREIVVWKGYDGEHNQLLSRKTQHTIQLHPPKGPKMQQVKVESSPGWNARAGAGPGPRAA